MLTCSLCDDPLLKDEVVVMEDNPDTLETIKTILEEELKWNVTIAKNKEEAINLADKKRAAYFVLDDWIEDDKKEGTKALKQIRQEDEMAYVVILSTHPDSEEMVKRLKGNLFQLKTNLKSNVRYIASEILKYRLKIIDKLKKDISKDREDIVRQIKFIEQPETNFCSTIISDEFVTNEQLYYGDNDPNIAAYESSKDNPEWFERHQGKYVAFVDGKFKFSCSDRHEFFKRLIESEEYKNKKAFYMQVEAQERIYEILPSVEILLYEKE